MDGFLEHIDEAYTKPGGFFERANLELSEADPEGRRIIGTTNLGTFVINARPVGGRNAGTFMGWITLSPPEWRRITGRRPHGWKSYTAVIGYAPDDKTIWWSAVYDDDILRSMEPESMEGGRWLRLPPEDAERAMVARVDMFQQTLELQYASPEPPPPGPAVRETILDTIHSGISLMLDDESMKHLPAEALVMLKTRILRAAGSIDKWREVRVAQSYSRQKSEHGES